MGERDHIIRVILEGKDRLSGALAQARSRLNNEINSIRRSLTGVQDDSRNFGRSFEQNVARGLDSAGEGFGRFRRRAREALEDLRRFRIQARETVTNIPAIGGGQMVRGPGGRFTRVERPEPPAPPVRRQIAEGIRGGLNVARNVQREIESQVASSREIYEDRRRQIAAEKQERADAIRSEELARMQAVRRENLAREEGLRRQIAEIERAQRGEQAQALANIAQQAAARREEARLDRNEITHQREVDLANLRAQRQGVGRGEEAEIRARAAREIEELQTRQANAADAQARRRIAQEITARRNALAEELRAREVISASERSAIDQQMAARRRAANDELAARDAQLQRELRELEATRRAINNQDLAAQRARIAELRAAHQEERENARAEVEREFDIRRRALNDEIRQRREALVAPDEAVIRRQARQQFEQISPDAGPIERFSQRAGLALGSFARGTRDGRLGLASLNAEARRSENVFTRAGIAFGSFLRNMGTFVNLRWLFITGIFQLFGTVVTAAVAGLVALGASAITAGAALGGALVAGAGQALAVLGLLRATLFSLEPVMQAVKLAEQNRVSATRDASEAADEQREANQRLADSQYSLLRAGEGVRDAQYEIARSHERVQDAIRNHRDAVLNLAEARRQAARDIVDAQLEERDAALSLQEAVLSVEEARRRLREEEERSRRGRDDDIRDAQAQIREAQERLRIAEQEGDAREISAARQDLAIAQSNASAIRDRAQDEENRVRRARIDVRRAEINEQQARRRAADAARESREAQRRGVEGAPGVQRARDAVRDAEREIRDARRGTVLASRALRDAEHQVAIAAREVRDARRAATDATERQTAAQKNLQDLLRDMSPAQRSLFRALVSLRRTFRENIRPITDIITGAFARAIRRVEELLRDPRILAALRDLAEEIADVIDRFSEFAVSQEGRETLLTWLRDAKDNVKPFADALANIGRTLIRIGQIGGPIFRNLLRGAERLTERLRGTTDRPPRDTPTRRGGRQLVGSLGLQGAPLPAAPAPRRQSQAQGFIESAEKHLDSWLRLGRAIGRVLGLITSGGRATGQGFLDNVTDKLNEWADWMERNPEKVEGFFDRVGELVESLANSARRLIPILVEMFTSEQAEAFARVVAEVLIPGLGAFLYILGQLSRALLFLLDIPIVGDLLKIAATAGIVYGAFNKLFPITRRLVGFFLGPLKRAIGFAITEMRTHPEGIRKGMAQVVENVRNGYRNVITRISTAWTTVKNLTRSAVDGVVSQASRMRDRVLSAWDTLRTNARRVGTAIRERLVSAFQTVAGASRRAATAIRERFISALQTSITWIRATATAIYQRLLAALGTLATFLRTTLFGALMRARTGVRLLVGATGIGLLIVAATLVIEHWDKVRGWFSRFVRWLDGLFGNVDEAIIGGFRKAIAWIRNKLDDLFGWIGRQLRRIPVIGKFFGGENRKVTASQLLRTVVREEPGLRDDVRRLRRRGLNDREILDRLMQSGRLSRGTVENIVREQFLQHGGPVSGPSGIDKVPARLTVGEWVLNKLQQRKLANALKTSVSQLQHFVFGSRQQARPGPQTTGTRPKPGARARGFAGGLNLHAQVDPDGNTVHFLEFADGTWGQVTGRDARRIERSNGAWLPGYVQRFRRKHGLVGEATKRRVRKTMEGGWAKAMQFGGVVSPVVQSFAAGGVVQNPGTAAPKGGNTVNQTFDVKVQGESDWNTVLRIGAIHAQGAY